MPEQQRASKGVASRRPAPLRSPLPLVCMILAISVAGPAYAATYTGTVFEDVNYGGGAGRSRTASGGVPIANVTVELYRVSNGNFMTSTTTDVNGFYSLTSTGNNAAQAMYVRVVNGSVRSSRTGGSGCTAC